MFTIKVADLNIRIDNKYPYLQKQCSNYMTNSDNIDFCISVSNEEIKAEQSLSDIKASDGYSESICAYRQICFKLLEYDAFLLHASVVKIDGKAYAFCGKSGAGKSTHTILLKQLLGDKLTVINGDKPILRFIDGELYAYGTPWAGKESLNENTRAPLKAICFLSQAKDNNIVPISSDEAAKRIMHQILIPSEESAVIKIFELLDKTLNKIPAWLLKCNISVQAAQLSYNTMKGYDCK